MKEYNFYMPYNNLSKILLELLDFKIKKPSKSFGVYNLSYRISIN